MSHVKKYLPFVLAAVVGIVLYAKDVGGVRSKLFSRVGLG